MLRSHCTLSLLSAVAMVGASVSSAGAQPRGLTSIQTGEQLRASCAAYLDHRETANATADASACPEFLAGFANVYAIGKRVELTSLISEATGEADDIGCFALPQYLSFDSFARIVVDFVNANPAYATKPAQIATGAALAAKYPCR